jgi:phage-related tail fiber protein
MLEKTYGTLVTEAGNAMIASAMLTGTLINLTAFALGDGGGAYYLPTENMTALKREVWRGTVNNVTQNEDSPNVIDVKAIIPSDVGGFTIREMALFTESGTMFAICNMPDTEKVILTSGAEGEIEFLMHVMIASAAVETITFTVDPNIIVATKNDILQCAETINLKILQLVELSEQPHSGDWRAWLEYLKEVPDPVTPGPP